MFVGFLLRSGSVTLRRDNAVVVTALFIFMVSSLLVAGSVWQIGSDVGKCFSQAALLYGAAGIMAGSIPVIWVFNSRTLSKG